jgi:hypothetical protein
VVVSDGQRNAIDLEEDEMAPAPTTPPKEDNFDEVWGFDDDNGGDSVDNMEYNVCC